MAFGSKKIRSAVRSQHVTSANSKMLPDCLIGSYQRNARTLLERGQRGGLYSANRYLPEAKIGHKGWG